MYKTEYRYWAEDNGIIYDSEINIPSMQELFKNVVYAHNPDHLYYFNANHLGSGSLITDKYGQTYQTLIYAPHGEVLFNKFYGDYDEVYKFTGYEKDNESGLDYAHNRYHEVNIGFNSTDPMWWKYPWITSYNYCANDPINKTDPDGKVVVDSHGRRTIYYDKQGNMHFTKYATSDIKRVANALNLTAEGQSQLKRMNQSDIKVKINISLESKIEKLEEGKVLYVYGQTLQGNNNNADNYGRKVNEDGTYGIKEATITIYEGTLTESIKEGSGLRHEGLTIEQAIGSIAGHESIHATDKSEIDKDLKSEMSARPRNDREIKPNRVEQKIIDQSKKANE